VTTDPRIQAARVAYARHQRQLPGAADDQTIYEKL
jgi:hypothetical protein